MRRVLLILFLSVVMVNAQSVYGQTSSRVECGNIATAEFAESKSVLTFQIELSPGYKLWFETERFGDYLLFNVVSNVKSKGSGLLAPSGAVVVSARDELFNFSDSYLPNIALETGVLGERGLYTIQLANEDAVGAFRLRIGCITDTGQVINPGDVVPPATPTPALSPLPANFAGFPGLAPVDFTGVQAKPITEGFGAVTPSGGEVFAFALNASGGTNLDLTVTRLSGNLNLGLVVLSANNEVVFQASLVTSQTLNTRFTLPAAGQYIIGVFRVDLLPPAAPEATAFQVQAALNP
ncbi:MAG: hypothetical protein DWB42_13120 [Chloroflexi bacterium]|nr:hypothetical protein [Chloroflexota bacterium]MDL1885446.1 hypothetical protein [Anaerolineae bacterium CFX8]